MSPTAVTSIGIGNMGAALASALLKASHPVTIWNRTASRPLARSLVTEGAVFQPDLAAAVAASPVILLCLVDYAAIHDVLAALEKQHAQQGGGRALAGKTVVNLTNGTPGQARAMEARCRGLGAARYFDGGVMVTPQLVGTEAAFVVLSGESEAAFREERIGDDHEDGLLRPVGRTLYVAEDAGAASLFDCAALAAMYGMFAGAFTGMGLLKRKRGAKDGEKVKIADSVNKVMVPVLTALVPYVSLLAEQIDQERWMDSLGNPLAMQLAGVKNIAQSCEEEGVDGSALKSLYEGMEKGVKEGYGDGGLGVVSKYFLKEGN